MPQVDALATLVRLQKGGAAALPPFPKGKGEAEGWAALRRSVPPLRSALSAVSAAGLTLEEDEAVLEQMDAALRAYEAMI